MDEAIPPATRISVAGFEIDLAREEVRSADGARVELRARSFAVLRLLASRPGRLVGKDEIMNTVWNDAVVTEDSLTQCIADIRRALSDSERRILRTVHRRGYMLQADAMPAAADAAAQAAPAFGPAWQQPRLITIAGLGAILLLGLLVMLWLRQVAPPRELPARASDRPSLAVLAFKAGVPEPRADLLAAGVATEVINELARNRDLRLIARDSSFALSGRNFAPREIGEQLRVRYLVDGTAQRNGDTLSVAVQLIDTRDNTVAWAEHFTASAQGVGDIQATIAARIATTLHAGMREMEKQAALRRQPRDLDVYELSLRGLALKHQFNSEATREGRRGLEEAIARDPSYAPAYLNLAWLNVTDILNQFTGEWGMTRMDEAIAQFHRAIELDPNLSAAYQGLSRGLTMKGDLEGAYRTVRRALELGPSDADNLLFLGTVQVQRGEIADAVRAEEQALDLNPIRPAYYARHYAEALWAAERHAEALAQSEECLRKAPRFTHCFIFRVLALVGLERAEEARAAYRAAIALGPAFETAVRAIVPKPAELAARYRRDIAMAR